MLFFQKRAKAQGWSSWTEWSTCSRSCDGGVAYQLRRCHAPHGCKGDAVRYKICNMQVSSSIHLTFQFRRKNKSSFNRATYYFPAISAMPRATGFPGPSVFSVRRRALRWSTAQVDPSLRLFGAVCSDVQVRLIPGDTSFPSSCFHKMANHRQNTQCTVRNVFSTRSLAIEIPSFV